MLSLDHRQLLTLDEAMPYGEWAAALGEAASLRPAPDMPDALATLARATRGVEGVDRLLAARIAVVVALGLVAVGGVLAVLLVGLPWAEPTSEADVGPVASSFGGVSERGAALLLGVPLAAVLLVVLGGWTLSRLQPSGAASSKSARVADAVRTLRSVDFVYVGDGVVVVNLPRLAWLAALADHADALDMGRVESDALPLALAELRTAVDRARARVVAERDLRVEARTSGVVTVPMDAVEEALAAVEHAANAAERWRRLLPPLPREVGALAWRP